MAKGNGKGKGKKNKSGLSIDEENKILYMKPADLAVECTFERNAINALNEQKKQNDKIKELEKEVKEHQEELDAVPAVVKAKEELEKAKGENMTPEHIEAKENLAALRKGFTADINDRKKKLNFMDKTLQRHIESGALTRTQ